MDDFERKAAIRRYGQREAEANMFARYLLLPEKELKLLIGENRGELSVDLVLLLARKFGISSMTMAHHLQEIGYKLTQPI